MKPVCSGIRPRRKTLGSSSVPAGRRVEIGRFGTSSSPRPRITTFFIIEGVGVVPAECTARIGLEATSSRAEPVRRGTLVPSGEPHILPPYWLLELKKEALDSTDDGLRNLLERLWPRRKRVRELLRETGWNRSETERLLTVKR